MYCFIIIGVVIHSSFCVYNSEGPHAYQILTKLFAPRKRLSTSDLLVAFTRRTNGPSMGSIQQAVLFRISGAINGRVLSLFVGWCSVVGIATGYGLDDPGIESWWGTRFSAPLQTGPGAHPATCKMSTGSFRGKERPRRDADPSPHGHERVELYLYSPYGPYGL